MLKKHTFTFNGEEMEQTFKIQNTMSTVFLGTRLDLKKITVKTRNSEYNPNRFSAVIMRIRQPKTTALIFQSGKMVCTGAKSTAQSKEAAKKFARIVKKLDFPVRFRNFQIQNIVATVDVEFPIRLEGLSLGEHQKYCTYEPELFAGLVYKMAKPKVCLLIFVSGKIVLTGAKSMKDLFTAFENIYPLCAEYKKSGH